LEIIDDEAVMSEVQLTMILLVTDKSLVFFGLARQVAGERVVAEAVAEAVEGT
jgi:hypothetical protein